MPNQRPSDEEIRNRAYQLFLERGGTPGNEIEDWIRAEQELRAGTGGLGATPLEALSIAKATTKGNQADVSDAPESGTRRSPKGADTTAAPTGGKGMDADVSDSPESGTRRDENPAVVAATATTTATSSAAPTENDATANATNGSAGGSKKRNGGGGGGRRASKST